jgi:hypothetical protein
MDNWVIAYLIFISVYLFGIVKFSVLLDKFFNSNFKDPVDARSSFGLVMIAVITMVFLGPLSALYCSLTYIGITLLNPEVKE